MERKMLSWRRRGLRRMARFAGLTVVPALVILPIWGVTPALAVNHVEQWHINGQPVLESSATGWKGTIKLTDTKAPLAGSVAVQCESTAEGSVGLGGSGEVTKWSSSACSVVEGCEKKGTPSIVPLHLPWHTELVASGEGASDLAVSGSGGKPGYELKCKWSGSETYDECTGTVSTTTTNASEGVTAKFAPSEKLTCVAGLASGSLEGSQSIDASGGGKLSVEADPVWQVSGSPLVNPLSAPSSGTVTLSDRLPLIGTIAVECEEAGNESVGAANMGEVAKLTMSNCKPAISTNSCESGASIEALHLPWQTVLANVESTPRQATMGGGSGTPGFELKCEAHGENVKVACPWMPEAVMKNVEGGVTATLNASGSCTEGYAGSSEMKGTRTLKSASGLLEVS